MSLSPLICLLFTMNLLTSNALRYKKGRFTPPVLLSGQRVEEWSAEWEVNPEELGEYQEGDIIKEDSRNGLVNNDRRWPGGVVPYEITGTFNRDEVVKIKHAMGEYHKNSCVRFQPRKSSDTDWISITSERSGCWSLVGRKGGQQDVNLQNPNCLVQTGTILHELLHVLGFHHEQNRANRDDFVTVVWENIKKGKESNFAKVGEDLISDFGVPYDYSSVLHYSEKAFSSNNKATIVASKKTNAKLGQRSKFSESDLEKLNLMYNCTKGVSETNPAEEGDKNEEDRRKPNFLDNVASIFFS